METPWPLTIRDVLAVAFPLLFNALIVWAVVRTVRRRRAERDALDQ